MRELHSPVLGGSQVPKADRPMAHFKNGGCRGDRTRLSPSSGARVICLSYAAIKWSPSAVLPRVPSTYQVDALADELQEDGVPTTNCTRTCAFEARRDVYFTIGTKMVFLHRTAR